MRQLDQGRRRRGRKVGIDDERVTVDALEAGDDGCAETRPGIAHDLRAGRHHRGVVGHDEHAADLRSRLHDVPEHRDSERGAHGRRQAALRIAAIRNHDRRHAAKRSQVPFDEFPFAPGPEVAHSRTSNQCVPRRASATSRSV